MGHLELYHLPLIWPFKKREKINICMTHLWQSLSYKSFGLLGYYLSKKAMDLKINYQQWVLTVKVACVVGLPQV